MAEGSLGRGGAEESRPNETWNPRPVCCQQDTLRVLLVAARPFLEVWAGSVEPSSAWAVKVVPFSGWSVKVAPFSGWSLKVAPFFVWSVIVAQPFGWALKVARSFGWAVKVARPCGALQQSSASAQLAEWLA